MSMARWFTVGVCALTVLGSGLAAAQEKPADQKPAPEMRSEGSEPSKETDPKKDDTKDDKKPVPRDRFTGYRGLENRHQLRFRRGRVPGDPDIVRRDALTVWANHAA